MKRVAPALVMALGLVRGSQKAEVRVFSVRD
jgi:hypothetical protein